MSHRPVPNTVNVGLPSEWPCPDCSGVLWTHDADDGSGDLYFRCRVGHTYGIESLRAAQYTQVETALITALRSLQDRAALNRTLAERAEHAGRHLSARRFRSELEGFEHSIGVIEQLLGDDLSEEIGE